MATQGRFYSNDFIIQSGLFLSSGQNGKIIQTETVIKLKGSLDFNLNIKSEKLRKLKKS